jgi:hypothetical protein
LGPRHRRFQLSHAALIFLLVIEKEERPTETEATLGCCQCLMGP